jgi:uncharacterized membrane protein YjjP (DUF1212 family)
LTGGISVRFLYVVILFVVGFACSAFLHGSNLKLSDALLFVIAGILYKMWNKKNQETHTDEN